MNSRDETAGRESKKVPGLVFALQCGLFSLCRKPVHRFRLIHLPFFTDDRRKMGVMYRVGEKLGLHAEPRSFFIDHAVLAAAKIIDEVAGIKLHTGGVGQYFHDDAGLDRKSVV